MLDRSPTLASLGASVLAALLLSPAVSAQVSGQPVWVVDDDGGAGTDFVDLQAAIDAASDGDVVLVQPGLYGSFEIAGKGVSLLAEVDGSVTCLGGALVRNVPTNSVVALRGIRTLADTSAGLVVRNCAGTLWIESCTLRGADGDGAAGSPTFHPDGYDGLRVIDGDEVVVIRSTLEGGDGSDLFGGFSVPGNGGRGASATKSEVALFGCSLRGGDGGDAATDASAADGGHGGAGLSLDAGAVTASGSLFFGGDGGAAGAFTIDTTTTCGAAGNGGDGIAQPTPPAGIAEVRILDCNFAPGFGGPSFAPGLCGGGAFGWPTRVTYGSVNGLAGQSFHHAAKSPVRLGESVDFEIVGEPGSIAVLAISTGPALAYDPSFNGAIVVDSNTLLTYPGQIAFDGTLTYHWVGGLTVQPGHALSVFAQPVFFVPSTLEFSAGSGSWLTILHPAL